MPDTGSHRKSAVVLFAGHAVPGTSGLRSLASQVLATVLSFLSLE